MAQLELSNDPFVRFERSRGGILIPLALFLVGTAVSVGAIETLAKLEQNDVAQFQKRAAEQKRVETLQQAKEEFRRRFEALSPEQRAEFLSQFKDGKKTIILAPEGLPNVRRPPGDRTQVEPLEPQSSSLPSSEPPTTESKTP